MADVLGSVHGAAPAVDALERALEACARDIEERGLRPITIEHVAERAGMDAAALCRLSPWADLRAKAYERVEYAMIDSIFPLGAKSELVMETWLSEAFGPRTTRAWQRWSDAWEMSVEDAAFAAAFARVQNHYFEELARVLQSGPWRLPDPEGTAMRLFALEDGFSSQIMSCAPFLNRKRAEAVLRGAFEAECRLSALI